ncbi:MAG: hypothetical protein OQK82_02870 [Candidatus Pacearchaeota archaeon]|nr:hypothetical protein [Candidatus Pacearchaeota archaeon]
MKKVMMCLLLGIFVLGFAIADNGNGQERDGTGEYHDDMIAMGGMNGSPSAEQIEARNEYRTQVQAGNYNVNGRQLMIEEKANNEVRLGSAGVYANSRLMIQLGDGSGNQSALRVMLSNGRDSEIKVMPNVASETALQRLRLRNCNESNNCTIELREVGQGNMTRAAYSVMAQKNSRLFGLFSANMNVEAEVDAETGEVITSRKPWWAFLASEKDETEESSE